MFNKNSESNSPNENENDNTISNNINFRYYSNNEFKNLTTSIKNPFSLFHTNIESLMAREDRINFTLSDLDFNFFDIVAFTETWNPKDKKAIFFPLNLEGYHPYSMKA